MTSNLRIGVIFLIVIVAAALLFLLIEPDKTIYYWFGFLTGSLLGIVTIGYMAWNKIIDPEVAQLTYRERIESPWIIISVVGGMILARVLFRLIPAYLEVFVINVVLSWIIFTFGYVAYKVWRSI